MKKILLSILSIAAFVVVKAQTATISPANSTIATNASQNFTVTTSGLGANDDNRSFAYTITGPGATLPPTPVVINCTSGCNSESHSFQFPTAGVYTVSVTVTQTQNGSAVASTSTSITVVDPLPIGCDASFYVSYDGPTLLDSLAFSGIIVDNYLFPTTNSLTYNGIGLNPIDGFIYGFTSGGNLLKVGRNASNPAGPHVVQDLGAVAPVPGSTVYAGCFDANGDFFNINGNDLRKITNAALNTTRANTAVATLNGSGDNNEGSGTWIIDIAISPATGKMYGVSSSGTAGVNDYRLYEINKTTGALTRLGAAGANSTGSYPHPGNNYIAALFFDETGNLYGYREDGAFLKMDLAAPQNSVAAGSGNTYSQADGCSCSFGRVYHDLDWDGVNQACSTAEVPNPEYPITISVSNASASQKTGLTYTLEIPGNRFSILGTSASIAQHLFDQGLLPNNNAGNVVISSTSGTNNKIVVTSFQTGGAGSTLNFTLTLKLVTLGGDWSIPVDLQSVISGLPAEIGSTDDSNDPETGSPDDPTTIEFCPEAPLPVALVSFDANRNGSDVVLSWKTVMEENNRGFELQRMIGSGNWTSIGFVHTQAPKGNSSSPLDYRFTDNNNSNGVSQYRLKQIDIDGKASLSAIRSVRGLQLSLKTIVYPNPSTDGKVSVIFEETNVIRNITLIDMNGRTLKQWKGVTNNNIQMENLQAGFYTIRIVNTETNEQVVEKVVVNKR